MESKQSERSIHGSKLTVLGQVLPFASQPYIGLGVRGQLREAPGSATRSPSTTSGATVDTAARSAVADAVRVPKRDATGATGRPAGALTGPNAATQATAAAQAAITAALSARAAPARAAAQRMSDGYSAALASARARAAATSVPEASARSTAATSSTSGPSNVAPQTRSLAPASSGYWEVAQDMHFLHADDGGLLGEYGTNGQYGAPTRRKPSGSKACPLGP